MLPPTTMLRQATKVVERTSLIQVCTDTVLEDSTPQHAISEICDNARSWVSPRLQTGNDRSSCQDSPSLTYIHLVAYKIWRRLHCDPYTWRWDWRGDH